MQAIHTGVLVYGSEYWYGAGLKDGQSSLPVPSVAKSLFASIHRGKLDEKKAGLKDIVKFDQICIFGTILLYYSVNPVILYINPVLIGGI